MCYYIWSISVAFPCFFHFSVNPLQRHVLFPFLWHLVSQSISQALPLVSFEKSQINFYFPGWSAVDNVRVLRGRVFAGHNVENEITESRNISPTKATGAGAGWIPWERTYGFGLLAKHWVNTSSIQHWWDTIHEVEIWNQSIDWCFFYQPRLYGFLQGGNHFVTYVHVCTSFI